MRALRYLKGSVRVRVTASALLAVAVALVIAASVLDVSLEHDRQRVLTATADEQAREVVSFNPSLRLPLVLPPEPTIQSGLVQVILAGKVVGESRPLRRLPPLWQPGDPSFSRADASLAGLAPDVRIAAVPVSTGGKKAEVVVVASMAQYDHTIADFQRLLEIGLPILLLVVAMICWLTVGRALRPIETMRREVAAVTGRRGPGEFRVAEPSYDDEVGRLARTLNSMLARIQASTERERRFVSDASHELRSPLANIRVGLEVALHHPERAEWQEVAHEVLDQNQRMEGLVAGLLLLARSDEGSLIESPDPVDLSEVVSSVVAAGSQDQGPEVVFAHGPAPVDVPWIYLERMVTNLLDNARRYAASRVTLDVASVEGWAVLTVRDDGPGVPESERERIFERFVRLDEARGRGAGGFGLGLAIVSDLSRHYGGSIGVRDADPGSGAEFVLRLPLSPAVSSSAGAGTQAVGGQPNDDRPESVGTRTLPPQTDTEAKVGTGPASTVCSTVPVAGSSAVSSPRG
jgi:signal transduction histidine kinase